MLRFLKGGSASVFPNSNLCFFGVLDASDFVAIILWNAVLPSAGFVYNFSHVPNSLKTEKFARNFFISLMFLV